MLNHADRAADAYSIAARLTPNDGNIWLTLGTTYLRQVESDARVMTSAYSHSPYVTLRAAETFAEEGKLLQAEDAYKTAIASGSPAPCTHAVARSAGSDREDELRTHADDCPTVSRGA